MKLSQSILHEELDIFEAKFKEAVKSQIPLLDRIMRFIVNRKGKQLRPMGYDRDDVYVMANGQRCELIIDLLSTEDQNKDFDDAAKACLGELYDWSAPWAFLLPGHHHQKFHSVCSAKMLMLLRKCGRLKWPLSVPAHLVSPRDLLLILSALMEVPH